MKKCNKCNAMSEDDIAFCTSCGNNLSTNLSAEISWMNDDSGNQSMPADQAAEFIKNTKEKTAVVSQNLQKVWEKQLLLPEKLMVVGIGLNIIAVFLLEFPFTWIFIFIAVMLWLLGLIYFSQGSDTMKMSFARWHMIIGAPLLLFSITIRSVMNAFSGYFWFFGSRNIIPFMVTIGLWAVLIWSLLIVVWAFRLQGALINRISKQ